MAMIIQTCPKGRRFEGRRKSHQRGIRRRCHTAEGGSVGGRFRPIDEIETPSNDFAATRGRACLAFAFDGSTHFFPYER